jgi:glycosyltransferase involved in cell wall biosynthesis
MTNLFFLLNDLFEIGEARTAFQLARMITNHGFRVTIGALGGVSASLVQELGKADIVVHSLPIRHALDVSGARRLRQVIQEHQPQIIHTWGSLATRLARIAISSSQAGNDPRLVVTAATQPGTGFGGWLTTRMLRRADRIIAQTWAEAERYRLLKVLAEQLTRISPASAACTPAIDRETLFRRLSILASDRLIVTVGTGEADISCRDAIIAFDMLRYEFQDLHLVIVASETESRILEQFARSIAYDDYRVHIINDRSLQTAAIHAADIVFCTRPITGVEETLEAMAAAKPVVAWDSSDLVEIVDDGVTGYVVPGGDRAALAATARRLLCDPVLAQQLGQQGRERSEHRFGLQRFIDQHLHVYTELS